MEERAMSRSDVFELATGIWIGLFITLAVLLVERMK
jgi:hypothetical protein